MPNVVEWEEGHGFPQERSHSLSPSLDDGVRLRCIATRHRNSYYRLPEEPLKLSVLKLDGSSFDVQIARTASVSELKLALEEVFSHSAKEGECKISWSHVWGYFCLCYDGHNLVDDKASLRSFGIKDGDQLHFIRHLSIYSSSFERRPRNHGAVSEQPRMSSTGPEVLEGSEENGKDKNDENDGKDKYADEHYHHYVEDEDLTGHTESKFAHLLRGWLPHSRLWSTGRMR